MFRGREIFLRIDPGSAAAITTTYAPRECIRNSACPRPRSTNSPHSPGPGVKLVGLHAHSGSGILDVANWTETGGCSHGLAGHFSDVAVVDLGGGIGVPEQAGQSGIDLAALDSRRAHLKRQFPRIEFWMEPGRFFVARAGVLVAVVTQLKSKGDVRYVGIATGMNSLISPALYGAHHDIRNLSRIGAH